MKKIGTAEAAKHYDESLTITGKVAQVTIRPRVIFLNLDQTFPDAPFTAVIFSGHTNAFGDLPKLKGRDVELTGTVTNYQGKPEIVLTNAAQLKVVEPSTSDKK
jgi:DNA/RNA endonuclease YhcR with UshA esterase domain